MGTNTLLQLHYAYEGFSAVRDGTVCPEVLIHLLCEPAYNIAEDLDLAMIAISKVVRSAFNLTAQT